MKNFLKIAMGFFCLVLTKLVCVSKIFIGSVVRDVDQLILPIFPILEVVQFREKAQPVCPPGGGSRVSAVRRQSTLLGRR